MSFKFESKDYSVEEALFGIHQLRVPQFQRPYTWGEDQCSDFWNDLIDDDSFFLGQFILNYENFAKEKFVDIVDGQQRTTSILILCAVFRDVAKSLGYSEDAEVIQDNSMLARRSFKGPEYRITVSPSLSKFFEKYIQSGEEIVTEDLKSSSEEEDRVIKNYCYFKEQVLVLLNDKPLSMQIDEIKRLFEFLKSAQVIVTKINDENDAYEIFESVNATGIELNVADLLKNFLFKKIKAEGGSTAEVVEKWTEMVNLVNESDLDLTKFLRYYWLSKYEFVSEVKLFRAIKNKNIANWKFFLQELLESAKSISDLRNPLEADFSSVDRGDKVKASLIGIKEMNITQCYVLLLCIYRNKHKITTNWANTFELIEKFNFLYHVTSKLPGNRVEKIYQEYASHIEKVLEEETDEKALRVSIETDFTTLKTRLMALIPPKPVFEIGFTAITYKKRGLCRYVLSKIEESLGSASKEYVLNQATITIEHILPQKPGKDWGLTPNQVKDYVHNIGNLTLLGKKPNGSVQNKSIKEKIAILKTATEVQMTQDLLSEVEKNGVWDKDTIEARAKKLSNLAFDKVWKIS